MINLDDYRQQLESSIAKVTGQNSFGTDDNIQDDLTGNFDEMDRGGGGGGASFTSKQIVVPYNNGGSLPDNASAAPAQANSGSLPDNSTAPAATPAQSGQAPPKNIDVVPPGVDLKFDPDKLKNAKSIADHVDAMEPQSRKVFLDWWQKQYGSINDNYDAMLEQIGKKPDPDRPLSKKDKWTALMNFGVSLIKASSSPDSTLVGSLAQATGDTVQGINAGRQQEQQQYQGSLQSAQDERDKQLKDLGNFGNALKGQATLDTADSNLQKAQNAPNQITKIQDTSNGLMGSTPNGALKPLIDPTTGKVARSNPNAKGGASRSTYEEQRDDVASLIKANNPKMTLTDAKNAAVKQLMDRNKPNGVNAVSIRKQAEEFAYKEMGSPKDYRASKNGGVPYSIALANAADRNYKMLLHIQNPEAPDSSTAPVTPPANRPSLQSFHH